MKLPRGIWYEKNKQRYRLRIQRNYIVMHRSYHRSIESAIQTLEMYKESQSGNTDSLRKLIAQTKLYYRSRHRNDN